MGKAKEWLIGGREFKRPDDHFKHVIQSASTDNGAFGLKIFPDQLNRIHLIHGYDFIRRCGSQYDPAFVVLERRDVVRHAISIVRYFQARETAGKSRSTEKPSYDYAQISAAIQSIEYNNAFWRTYLRLNGLNYRTFIYEDLLDDTGPFLTHIQAALGLAPLSDHKTDRRIIRDELTDEWATRFTSETIATGGFPHLFRPGTVPRTLDNLSRFLRGRAMT